jgi:hypothetical protein
MKSVTHNALSLGVTFYIARHAGFSLTFSLILAIWLSFAVNWVIDALGHGTRGGRPVRTFITHSVLLAPVWGGMIGYTSIVLANAALQLRSGWILAIFASLLGALIALSHLFLDALTEGGVYWRLHKVALAHARHNNPVLNAGFLLLGLALLAAPFLGY